jgi:hypothetical protein
VSESKSCGCGTQNGVRKPRPSCLEKIYQLLTLGDKVEPADLVIVMAGRMDRKHYGLRLFRQGIAPKLLLSVGRYEISQMPETGLPGVDRLLALRSITPPDQRHFFISLDASGMEIERASLPSWNTYGEVVGLLQYLARADFSKVMVVTTDIHLQRVARTIRKLKGGRSPEFRYCPVPEVQEIRKRWWKYPENRSYVLSELVKLAGYTLILSLPAHAAAKLMMLVGRRLTVI